CYIRGMPSELPANSIQLNDAVETRCRAWLGAIARGDEAALTALYRATVDRTFAVAVSIVSDRSLAEDVTAEVYHGVWQKAATFDPSKGRALTWILTMSRNRAIDTLRQRAVRARTVENAAASATDDSSDGPEDLLDALESGHRVQRALASLSDDERQLVALAFFRDYSHAEIASHTGQPLGTVKSRIRRALQAMGRELETEQTA
ncbi:MAG: sigma-70 family RNA polymerase sigma factor, partial [Pseudomonadota bacterium]